MASGDRQDMLARLHAVLPPWFDDRGPVLGALLAGLAQGAASAYELLAYVQRQTRIATATDDNLDVVAADFFGDGLMRHAGQADASYRRAIVANLMRERATRPALVRALAQLTGRAPVVLEPGRPADFGGYGAAYGYGAGGYGFARPPPFQSFVRAYLPADDLAAPGYGCAAGGYGVACAYGASNVDRVADIHAAVERVRPVGTLTWVAIDR